MAETAGSHGWLLLLMRKPLDVALSQLIFWPSTPQAPLEKCGSSSGRCFIAGTLHCPSCRGKSLLLDNPEYPLTSFALGWAKYFPLPPPTSCSSILGLSTQGVPGCARACDTEVSKVQALHSSRWSNFIWLYLGTHISNLLESVKLDKWSNS